MQAFCLASMTLLLALYACSQKRLEKADEASSVDLAADVNRHHKYRWSAVPHDHTYKQQDHAFRWHVSWG